MTAKVRTGDHFPVKREVRQGDPLSPKSFTAALEYIFRRLDFNKYGLNINGMQLNHLIFADDLTLLSQDAASLQEMKESGITGCRPTSVA